MSKKERTIEKKTIVFGCIATAAIIFLGSAYFFVYNALSSQHSIALGVNSKDLPVYIAASLAPYNGTDEKLPIYVALDGYVYDVTPGKEFYVPGGAYHDIAGKDASAELHIFGGGIIKEKYKIVGIFSNQ